MPPHSLLASLEEKLPPGTTTALSHAQLSSLLSLVQLTELTRLWLHRTCLQLLEHDGAALNDTERGVLDVIGKLAEGQQLITARERFWSVTVGWRRLFVESQLRSHALSSHNNPSFEPLLSELFALPSSSSSSTPKESVFSVGFTSAELALLKRFGRFYQKVAERNERRGRAGKKARGSDEVAIGGVLLNQGIDQKSLVKSTRDFVQYVAYLTHMFQFVFTQHVLLPNSSPPSASTAPLNQSAESSTASSFFNEAQVPAPSSRVRAKDSPPRDVTEELSLTKNLSLDASDDLSDSLPTPVPATTLNSSPPQVILPAPTSAPREVLSLSSSKRPLEVSENHTNTTLDLPPPPTKPTFTVASSPRITRPPSVASSAASLDSASTSPRTEEGTPKKKRKTRLISRIPTSGGASANLNAEKTERELREGRMDIDSPEKPNQRPSTMSHLPSPPMLPVPSTTTATFLSRPPPMHEGLRAHSDHEAFSGASQPAPNPLPKSVHQRLARAAAENALRLEKKKELQKSEAKEREREIWEMRKEREEGEKRDKKERREKERKAKKEPVVLVVPGKRLLVKGSPPKDPNSTAATTAKPHDNDGLMSFGPSSSAKAMPPPRPPYVAPAVQVLQPITSTPLLASTLPTHDLPHPDPTPEQQDEIEPSTAGPAASFSNSDPNSYNSNSVSYSDHSTSFEHPPPAGQRQPDPTPCTPFQNDDPSPTSVDSHIADMLIELPPAAQPRRDRNPATPNGAAGGGAGEGAMGSQSHSQSQLVGSIKSAVGATQETKESLSSNETLDYISSQEEEERRRVALLALARQSSDGLPPDVQSQPPPSATQVQAQTQMEGRIIGEGELEDSDFDAFDNYGDEGFLTQAPDWGVGREDGGRSFAETQVTPGRAKEVRRNEVGGGGAEVNASPPLTSPRKFKEIEEEIGANESVLEDAEEIDRILEEVRADVE